MKFRNYLQLLFGISTYFPFIYNLRSKRKGSGGTFSSRYCIAVWFRHLISIFGKTNKKKFNYIAEIGPGDSIGVGILALLLGAKKYYAFDVVKFADIDKNLIIFREIVRFLKNRENIPNEKEFPKVNPMLNDYDFPSYIYSDEYLEHSLRDENLEKIEYSISNQNRDDSLIVYENEWDTFNSKVKENSLDLIFSQATMEHIDEVERSYETMNLYLRKGGLISHSIDFRSHGYASTWDGHWLYSDLYWKLLRGRRPYLINRLPLSKHIKFMKLNNFEILDNQIIKNLSNIKNKNKNKNFFSDFDENDFTSSVTYLLGSKKN